MAKTYQDELNEIAALKMWMNDEPFRVIAKKMGCSPSTAFHRVQRARDAMRPHQDFERYRSDQLAEILIGRLQLRKRIVADGVSVQDLVAALTVLMRVQDQEAKLVGLEHAPSLGDLEDMTDTQLEAIVSEWANDQVK